ncbi:MAG: nuclear transport factor 2 family protein [Verrucomicrobia bacterium]|nr:nuclear transport factor 2 family protein [Verrucomicrobiota bacterium]
MPAPVAALVAAMNGHEAAAVEACFASDAEVSDEGRTHRGGPAIRAWFEDVSRRYRATLAVTDVVVEGDDAILTGEVSGNFEGSPIELRYRLRVRSDKIAAFSVEP